MSRVVVDTDVVSFVFKNHPVGALYEADLAGRTLVRLLVHESGHK